MTARPWTGCCRSYSDLKRLASRQLRGEAAGHTLQTTALVHEAYLRLAGSDVSWEGRRHFFAVASQVMRRVLVDHAKKSPGQRAKRGGGAVAVTLQEEVAASDRPADLLDLDEALERLAAQDPRKGRIIDLIYFGGLSYEETARMLEISPATVHRDLRLARAWLHRELARD